ncbi:type II secretion system F family protein [Muricomes intestini]|uniref:type II secretion system F family protein n=1 Tax=Muricomes intestini TaxID=1796634 RepID=UPI0026ADD1FA
MSLDMWNSVYRRMSVVFLSVSVLAVLVFFADNNNTPQKNKEGKYVLERGTYGAGDKAIDLEVCLEKEREPLTVTVGEQQYSEEQLPEIFKKGAARLENLILGENTSLDEVRYNLNLIDKIPDSGITVAWETDNYDVVNIMGELQREHLQEEGTPVELRALLSCKDEEAVHTFYANIYPPKLNVKEKELQNLNQQIKKQEESTREDAYLILPDKLDEKPVSWRYAGDSRALGLFVLGIVASGAIYILERQKEKQRKEARQKQLESDYPQLVSQFTLFLGAGMTVRKAWFKMVQEYEKQKEEKKIHAAYEEMLYTMHEIQGGVSERECYERFGSRCQLPSYRKFGALLSQNLRKGTKGMSDLLRREAAEAFEERKKQARKKGEEAGTKLLGPMFMMLAIVLIIIVVPAFLTIQI